MSPAVISKNTDRTSAASTTDCPSSLCTPRIYDTSPFDFAQIVWWFVDVVSPVKQETSEKNALMSGVKGSKEYPTEMVTCVPDDRVLGETHISWVQFEHVPEQVGVQLVLLPAVQPE